MAEDNEKIEKRRAANRASYERHKEERQAKARAWRAANPERMKELNAKWYAENREYAQAKRKVYTAEHREQMRALAKRWNDKHKGRKASLTRLKFTGCTPERYAALMEQQHGLCAICGKPPGRYALSADHCHTTKVVRGLLCGKCNHLLGLAGDQVSILETAIAYLQQYQPVAEGHDLGEGAS